jgi:hypothetical protein
LEAPLHGEFVLVLHRDTLLDIRTGGSHIAVEGRACHTFDLYFLGPIQGDFDVRIFDIARSLNALG